MDSPRSYHFPKQQPFKWIRLFVFNDIEIVKAAERLYSGYTIG